MSKSRTKWVMTFLGWTAAVCSAVALVLILVGAHLYGRYQERAEAFDLSKIDEVAERSSVYDGNGEFYSYFGGANRMVVPLSKVSKHFINALLAREDARFWDHGGVDMIGVARALVTNILAGDSKQGASTLTQQLARNACELNGKTLDRKALEAVLALRIEKQYSKDQILEFYVNRIYFGSGYYGIETASRGYFGKAAADLTLGEAATLAGLIRSPNRLAPSKDLNVSRAERDSVLDRMVETNMLTSEEAVAAKSSVVKVNTSKRLRLAEDYVMDAVMTELEKSLAPEVLEYGGLKVYVTVDPQLQQLAQSAANRFLTEVEEKKGFPHPRKKDFASGPDEEKQTDYIQSAVVAIENKTGAIRAIVGGRDYKESKYSRALLSRRPVGSTFKPFVYAAAFERGLLPGTAVDDSKIAPGEFRNIPGDWSPENSDGEYEGMRPAAFGLLKSKNTMTVRIGEFVGLPKIRELANNLGIGEAIPDYPVAFLGAFETSLKDLTAAYTIFPNLGKRCAPYLISRVEDRDGRVLFEVAKQEQQVLSEGSAWMASAIMQQIMKTGTASKSASLGWTKPGAGKTGTTNDFFDAWFVGYTSSLTCGVWVGMDKPQTIDEKAYGSALALPIWVDVMQHVPESKYPAQAFAGPANIVKSRLCSVSGARATSSCIAHGCAYDTTLPANSAPTASCQTHPEPVRATTYAAQPAQPAGAQAYTLQQGEQVASPNSQVVIAPSSTVATVPPPQAVVVQQPSHPQVAATPQQPRTAAAPIRITQPGRRASGTTNPAQFQPANQVRRQATYQRTAAEQTISPAASIPPRPVQRRVVVEEEPQQLPPERVEHPREARQARPVEVRRAIPVQPTVRRGLFDDDDDD